MSQSPRYYRLEVPFPIFIVTNAGVHRECEKLLWKIYEASIPLSHSSIISIQRGVGQADDTHHIYLGALHNRFPQHWGLKQKGKNVIRLLPVEVVPFNTSGRETMPPAKHDTSEPSISRQPFHDNRKVARQLLPARRVGMRGRGGGCGDGIYPEFPPWTASIVSLLTCSLWIMVVIIWGI